MSKHIVRFEDAISGVIHGFDRIVFQGFIGPIVFPEGAMNFFDSKGILYKDAKPWMETQTERLVTRIDYMSISHWLGHHSHQIIEHSQGIPCP